MTEQPPATTDAEQSEPVVADAPPPEQESQEEAPGANAEPPEPEPTPEELAAQEETQHAHFLATYDPCLTRLPDAIGTAPEQEFVPADAPEEHEPADAPAEG